LRADPLGDLRDVFGRVALRGERHARVPSELPIADRDALAEELDPPSGVVHVVLARDGRAVEREHVREDVADRTATRVLGRRRAGGLAPALRLGRGSEPRGDGIADEIARGGGHRAESAGSIAAASPRGWCARKKSTSSAAATRYDAANVARFAVYPVAPNSA